MNSARTLAEAVNLISENPNKIATFARVAMRTQ